MADSISIVMKMNDDISSVLKSISSTSKGVSKEFEELKRKTDHLGQCYAEFNKKSAQTSAEAMAVKKAMGEAAKSFQKTGDEADKVRFEKLKGEYDSLTASAKTYSKAAQNTIKEIGDTHEAIRKLEGGSGGSGGQNALFGSGLGAGLAQSGLIKELGNNIASAAGTLISSAVGQPMATMISSTLSGVASGAAAGALAGSTILPGLGTAAGAVLGGASGLISGGTQIYEQKDNAFKDYYKSLYETVNQATEESLTGGKALAARRETNKLSFTTLLGGEGQADAFLGNVLKTANTTPFLYDDLVGISKTLLSFGYAVDDIIPTLTKVGDAGAAMGLSTADIGTVATYIGRMKSSDKASLEYLNPLNERGLGVFQWLSDDLRISQKAVYDKISKGELSGSYVTDLILSQFEKLYGGMMEIQSKSTEGLDSTLQGLMENIDAAGGSRYNELRNEGKEADINAYGGQLGQAMENVNALAGETKARLENLEGQYEREALSAVLLGEKTSLFSAEDKAKLDEMRQQFIDASNVYEEGVRLYGKGDLGAAQEMVNLQENAKALATLAYESSGEYQKIQDQTLDQIDAIRANTIGLEAATNEYRISNAFTKGLGSWMPKFISTVAPGSTGGLGSTVSPEKMGDGDPQDWNRHAYGLKRVPFDGYPALLHQDERVLTAAEAREQGSGGLQVTFSGPITVRQDSDLDEIARRLADKLEQARMRAG